MLVQVGGPPGCPPSPVPRSTVFAVYVPKTTVRIRPKVSPRFSRTRPPHGVPHRPRPHHHASIPSSRGTVVVRDRCTRKDEDGGVFVYDLCQSPVVPVASARLPPGRPFPEAFLGRGTGAGAGAALCLSFNPKQRDLLATGDSLGRVLIWRLSWRLANKKAGEEESLQRLFRGCGSEVGPRVLAWPLATQPSRDSACLGDGSRGFSDPIGSRGRVSR